MTGPLVSRAYPQACRRTQESGHCDHQPRPQKIFICMPVNLDPIQYFFNLWCRPLNNIILILHKIDGGPHQAHIWLHHPCLASQISATDYIVTEILPLPGRTSSDVCGSKHSTMSQFTNPAGMVQHSILSSPTKCTSQIMFFCGSVISA